MKHIKLLCSILCCLILCTMLAVTVSADTTLPFTREEAYDKIMNMEADDAVRAFGGEEEYINAISQSDREHLFNAMWDMQVAGELTEPDAHYFAEEYFSTIISSFRKTDSIDEGITNLHNTLAQAADMGYGTYTPAQTTTTKSTNSSNSIVDPVESENDEQTTSTTTTSTTATTAMQQSSDGPSSWIWILAIVAFGILGIAIYLMFRKK